MSSILTSTDKARSSTARRGNLGRLTNVRLDRAMTTLSLPEDLLKVMLSI